MKKIITIFASMIIGVLSLAQSHMTFKDIEINGSQQAFLKALVGKGFEVYNEKIVQGDFANHQVMITTLNTPKTNIVWKVLIMSTVQTNTWSDLKLEYEKLLQIYTLKYGESQGFHFFKSPNFEGDDKELEAIENGNLVWEDYFTVEDGYIILEIFEGSILIMYEDSINAEIYTNERDSIVDDI